jgi:hypothetical protein
MFSLTTNNFGGFGAFLQKAPLSGHDHFVEINKMVL